MIKRFKKKHIELCCNGVFLNCTNHGDLSLEHSFSTSGWYGGCIPFRVPILFVKNIFKWQCLVILRELITLKRFKHKHQQK